MKTESRRFRRGETSSERPGLVFLRYFGDREVWTTIEKLAEVKARHRATDAKQRKKPGYKEKQREYFRTYNHTPKQKAYQSAYYKQPNVRKRYRDKWRDDPTMREKAKRYAKSLKAKEAAKRHREKPDYKAKHKAYMKAYWPAYHAERYANDPAYRKMLADQTRRYNARNRDKINARYKRKRDTNPSFRIAGLLRNRIRGALRAQPGSVKILRTEQLIGCSMEALLLQLQLQFTEGMTISDLMSGKIHLDHHLPCAMFDLTKPENQLKCFNFRNLKPMWAADNISKSDKIEGELFPGRELRKIIPFSNAG